MKQRFADWLVQIILSFTLILAIGWPIVLSLVGVMSPTANPLELIDDEFGRASKLLWNTIKVTALTVLLAVPSGTILAWLLSKTDLRGRWFFSLLLVFGSLIPLPILALGWIGGFGNLGRLQVIGATPWLIGWPAASFVHAVWVLPWVVLITAIGTRSLESELEELALLHWSAREVVLRLTLRRTWPAIASASVLAAAFSATDMTVTDLIPVRTYAEEAYLLSQLGMEQGPLIMRSTLPQLTLLGSAVFLASLCFLRFDLRNLVTGPRSAWRFRLGSTGLPIFVLVSVFLGVVVGLPIYGLVWRAGRITLGPNILSPTWSPAGLAGSLAGAWSELMGSGIGITQQLPELGIEPQANPEGNHYLRAPLPGSLVWSALAASTSVVLAWNLVWLARRSWVWKFVALTTFTVVIATPGPILGLVLKQAYVGILSWNRTPVLLVIALFVRTIPYSLAVAGPVLWPWPRAWEDQAKLAGMSHYQQVFRLIAPIHILAIATSWLLAFVFAMGELPAAYLTYAPGYDLVSLLVWSMLHVGVESRLAAIGLILLALLLVPTIAIYLLICCAWIPRSTQ